MVFAVVMEAGDSDAGDNDHEHTEPKENCNSKLLACFDFDSPNQ